jgi:hypothetical protein
MIDILPPAKRELEETFGLKYGHIGKLCTSPSMRRRFPYNTPDEYLEARTEELVQSGCTWLDVGCGHNLFPSDPP